MQNQSPVSIVASRAADHLKRHSQLFVHDGPCNMTLDQRAARQREIESCGDAMASSQTYDQFEKALRKAHRLGMYPYNRDVSIVAHADVLFSD